eukprot:EG_transcript_20465
MRPPVLAVGGAAGVTLALTLWLLLPSRRPRPLRGDLLAALAAVCAAAGYCWPLRLLHRLGADLQRPSPDGRTPLALAAGAGHTAAVRQLLRLSAARDPTALYAAIRNGHAGAVDVLLRADPIPRWLAGVGTKPEAGGWQPLFVAVESGSAGVVHCLLDHHCDVDQPLEDGTTPLIYAAELGRLPVVELLLRCGADAGRVRWDGCTAFLIAAQNGHTRVVDWLLDIDDVAHVPTPGSGGVVMGGGLLAAAAMAQGLGVPACAGQ